MSKELDDPKAKRDRARQQAEVWKRREEQAKQRVQYPLFLRDNVLSFILILSLTNLLSCAITELCSVNDIQRISFTNIKSKEE